MDVGSIDLAKEVQKVPLDTFCLEAGGKFGGRNCGAQNNIWPEIRKKRGIFMF